MSSGQVHFEIWKLFIILNENSFRFLYFALCCSNLATTWNTNGIVGASRISKLHSFESVLEFELIVGNLESQYSSCVKSTEFELHDVVWRIQACRNHTKFVHLSLVSVFSGDSAAWSCEANATFKALSIDGKESIVEKFESYNFNKDEPVRTIEEFVTWDNLLKKYVNDGRAIFEIAITTKTPNRAAKLDERSAKFDVIVNNVNRLGYEYSKELILRGIRWKILSMKIDDHFGIFLLANGDDMGIDVTWNVSVTFNLMSSTTNNRISKSFSDIPFDWTNLNRGFFKFIKWTDFIDPSKKFVENNRAMVKVELSVSEPIKSA